MNKIVIIIFVLLSGCIKPDSYDLTGIWLVVHTDKKNLEFEELRIEKDYLITCNGDQKTKNKYEVQNDLIIYYDYVSLEWRKFAYFRIIENFLILDQGDKSILKKQ